MEYAFTIVGCTGILSYFVEVKYIFEFVIDLFFVLSIQNINKVCYWDFVNTLEILKFGLL